MTTAWPQHGVRIVTQAYEPSHYLTTSALIFFEYIITFDQEVKLFWGKKLTGAIGLFFANRYTTVVYTIYFMLTKLVPSTSATAHVGLPYFHRESVSNMYCADVMMF